MAGTIPVQNIYYLLLYAWNRLPEGKAVDVSGVQGPEIPNLLAKVLLEGTRHLLRRGLDRDYIERNEDLTRPRGRLLLSDTISRGLLSRVQVACNTDDLSHHVLQNSILKTTIEQLIKTDDLDSVLREELLGLSASFYGVPTIRIAARDFGRVKLHGNNELYRLLLRVCELVHDSLVPSETPGRFIFRDLLADPQAMGRIFQSFIRNFYKLEQSRFIVSANRYGWPVLKTAGKGQELLPQMNTDVSLHDETRTILIECKWTPECRKQLGSEISAV